MTKVSAMRVFELKVPSRNTKNNAVLEQIYSNPLGWLVWFSLFSWCMRTGTRGFLALSLLQIMPWLWHKTHGAEDAWTQPNTAFRSQLALQQTRARSDAEEPLRRPYQGRCNLTANKTRTTTLCITRVSLLGNSFLACPCSSAGRD